MPPRFLVDTNILVYLQTKRSPTVERRVLALPPGETAMSVITFGELFYGLSKSAKPHETLERLRTLTHAVPVLPLPQDAAEAYGHIRSELETRGKMIGNNGLWIAAHAKAAGLILVTNNEREFRRIEGLKIENWTR
jgi:tRNA(fMet)-specific endonuclease VapC